MTPRLLGTAMCLMIAGTARPAPPDPLLARTIQAADALQKNAARLVTTETLHQRCYQRPPHGVISVGAAALQFTQFLAHDIVSEYTIARLKGGAALLEVRELVSMDARPVQTPAAARRALSEDLNAGEERARKHILEEFTKFGLTDVATDYGTILLAFTTAGVADLKIARAGDAFVGTEEAARLDWAQISGGALEFRGRKTARRAMQGSIWIRKADGVLLRIAATFEHREPQHVLRDDATIDYAFSPALGFPTPITVAHRHFVDGQGLTENLYAYEPFRMFSTDTKIQYETTRK